MRDNPFWDKNDEEIQAILLKRKEEARQKIYGGDWSKIGELTDDYKVDKTSMIQDGF